MHACSACPGADPLAWTGCRSLVSVAPHSAAAAAAGSGSGVWLVLAPKVLLSFRPASWPTLALHFSVTTLSVSCYG